MVFFLRTFKLFSSRGDRCYITPLLGAYIADEKWGRYNTVQVAVAIALVGHIILIVSAVPGVIEKESAIGAFVVGMVVTGLGVSDTLNRDSG
jgi:proton-dependent oligopeptide transporter, POT family